MIEWKYVTGSNASLPSKAPSVPGTVISSSNEQQYVHLLEGGLDYGVVCHCLKTVGISPGATRFSSPCNLTSYYETHVTMKYNKD